jgi:aspartyl-tRNA synthetase
MGESMGELKRTHMCGEVTNELVGSQVVLNGWVQRRRDLGKLIFIYLEIVKVSFRWFSMRKKAVRYLKRHNPSAVNMFWQFKAWW